MKKPQLEGRGLVVITGKLSGSSQEVEGGSGCGTEVDSDGLSVVRIHRDGGTGQDRVHGDRAGLGVVHAAAADDAVGVQLEGCATLLTLQHVFDHAVRDRKVIVGHVHRAGTSAIAKAGDVVLEGNILTRGLTDGGDVDFSAADVEFPVADLTNHNVVGVSDLEFVGASGGALGGDRDDRATQSGRNGQGASAGGIADHVIGGASCNTRRQCASSGAASLVDDAEFDGIAYFEVVVGTHVQDCANDGNVGGAEGGGGACRFVVQGAGRAGKNGGGHRTYLKNEQWGGHCPASTRLARLQPKLKP